MTLNAHYIVLFKNPSDVSQFANLARQMYPKTSQFAVEAGTVQLSVSRPSTRAGRRVATENKHFSRRDSLRIRSKGIKKEVHSSTSSVYVAVSNRDESSSEKVSARSEAHKKRATKRDAIMSKSVTESLSTAVSYTHLTLPTKRIV